MECNVDNCSRKYFSNGYCNYHFHRIARKKNVCAICGKPTIGKECMDCKKKKVCSVDGCERQHYGKTFCALHYRRYQTHGSPHLPEKIVHLCFMDGCENIHFGKGFCKTHYYQYRNQNRPKHPPKVRVYKERKCSVDGCFEKHFSKGMCHSHYSKKRYAESIEENRKVSLERYWVRRNKFLNGKYINPVCEVCSAKDRLNEHHLCYASEGIEEIVLLCVRCHAYQPAMDSTPEIRREVFENMKKGVYPNISEKMKKMRKGRKS